MNMHQTCDPDRLDAFVRGELSEQQESDLTAHLDQCASCGEELERRVAEADQWREAGELLTHRARRSRVMDLANGPSTNGSLATSTTFAEQMDQVVGMLAPTDDPEMLGRIGGYEVSGVIGCGGMGVVFKAHDRSLDRVVAIKVMAPHLAGSGAARKRFARESKAAAAVLHPNVIAIHCVADDPKLPYLVMPYIGGASLQKRVEADGPLCIQDTLRIGQQIAAGLAAAHAQGLVHRDIKPANILLERGVERVTITDFGLARAVDDATMTRSGVIAGTPQYMSPEQARGESIDHRSDLFSLGSVLYMMCAGHSPFRAETTFGILRRITDNQPRPLREINPDVPEWLCAIIEKLHAKEPSERFQSAEEVAQLLEGCLAHVQQPAAIPLPTSVEQLSQLLPASQLLRAVSTAPQPAKKQLRQLFYNLPPIGKFIAAAAFAFSVIFAGVLIVLELGKGTLTIESELDDVPIHIMQGEDVVKSLTVSKEGATTRIGAGKYIVEIGQEFDKAVIKDGGVELSRGATAIVKVTQTNANTAEDEKAKDEAAKAWLRRPVVGSTHDGKSFQLAGHDALMHCVMTNNSEALNRLLTMDKYDLDFSPGNGQWTLLQTALLHECVETTSLLLQHGANPNFAGKGTPLPLELAQRSGRKELFTLVQRYLESNAPQTNMDVRHIFADIDGEVTKILVGHNSVVMKGQLLLGMRNDELKLELTKTADQMKESSAQLDGITKKIQDNKDLSINEVLKMEKDRSELQKHVAALSVQLKKLKDRYELLYVKSTVDGKVVTKNVEQLLKNRSVVAGQVLLEIAIEPSRNITEKTANHAGEDGGGVTIPLKAEWVPEDWLKRNIGRRHLTIVADGIIQDEAMPNVVNRVQRGILHDCRLESYEKTSRDGVEYWNATFFVPRKPVYSIGALWFKDAIRKLRIGDRHTPVPSPDLTQDNPQVKLDEAMTEGHVFRLDYVNDDFENNLPMEKSQDTGSTSIQETADSLVTITFTGTTDGASITASGIGWRVDDSGHILVPSQVVPKCDNESIQLRYASGEHCSAKRLKTLGHLTLLKSDEVVKGQAISLDSATTLTSGDAVSAILNGTDKVLGSIVEPSKTIALSVLEGVKLSPELRFQNIITTDFVADETTFSGAPLLTKDGDVAGMIIRLGSAQLIAIPVAEIRESLKQLTSKDSAVTVPPIEFDTLEDFLKPGRELFDKEMKQIDERLATVVEGSAEHLLLTMKKKQLQQQWDLSVVQVKGMAAAAEAESVTLQGEWEFISVESDGVATRAPKRTFGVSHADPHGVSRAV